jgi:Fe-S cluster assembly protein SufD
LNRDALFYLRTRGIGLDDAKSLLVTAFSADITSRVGSEPLREALDHLVAARLAGALKGGPLA